MPMVTQYLHVNAQNLRLLYSYRWALQLGCTRTTSPAAWQLQFRQETAKPGL